MTEAELCQRFINELPENWTAYPETQGFDILLVHDQGFQIAVEAKLKLNVKVLLQVLEGRSGKYRYQGPDFRAVLVGDSQVGMKKLASYLGVTVLHIAERAPFVQRRSFIYPELPEFIDPSKEGLPKYFFGQDEEWFDEFPVERLALPEYVPDVVPGKPSPQIVSHWKIQAMKICIWVERNSVITRKHFSKLRISPSFWMTGNYLKKGDVRGEWVAGPGFPLEVFKKQHPSVLKQIEADYETWSKVIRGDR